MAGGRRVTVMMIKMVRRSFENVELANKSGEPRPGAGREPAGSRAGADPRPDDNKN